MRQRLRSWALFGLRWGIAIGGMLKPWAIFGLRWGIAIAGIWWVVANMSLRDHVLVLDEALAPVRMEVTRPAAETSRVFFVHDPETGQERAVARTEVVSAPDTRSPVRLKGGGRATLVALDLSDDLKSARRLLVAAGGTNRWISPLDVEGKFRLKVPHPRLEVGVVSLARAADPALLAMSVLVFPIVFFIVAARWNALLRVLDIRLTQARTFVLTMVGAFYNTFMPGSTGGDVLKAYYASRQTPHRARAVLSVVIDRVIGLLALVMLGGAMATAQYFATSQRDDPAAEACWRVASGAGAIVAGLALALVIFGHSGLRRGVGLDALLQRLPLQKLVQHGINVMRAYRDKAGVVAASLVVTFPVHITVVLSALLAGKAFGLAIPAAAYFVIVPVIVLAGAVPLSPQGVGVMEFFAILLTARYGATVSQAFALTMSIRLVQMLWNLTGGVFVLRGGYHAPTTSEKEELDREEAAEFGGRAESKPGV